MATLYRKEGSPFYWMRFQYKGKRYQESTKKDNHNAALGVMNKRIAEIKGSGGYHDLFTRLIAEIERQPVKKRDAIRRELAAKLLSGTSSKLRIEAAFELYKQKPKKRRGKKPTK